MMIDTISWMLYVGLQYRGVLTFYLQHKKADGTKVDCQFPIVLGLCETKFMNLLIFSRIRRLKITLTVITFKVRCLILGFILHKYGYVMAASGNSHLTTGCHYRTTEPICEEHNLD